VKDAAFPHDAERGHQRCDPGGASGGKQCQLFTGQRSDPIPVDHVMILAGQIVVSKGLHAVRAMVFKLIESAQARGRAVNAPHLAALVRAGARFEHGYLVERDERQAA
jgi:hypothetical protein